MQEKISHLISHPSVGVLTTSVRKINFTVMQLCARLSLFLAPCVMGCGNADLCFKRKSTSHPEYISPHKALKGHSGYVKMQKNSISMALVWCFIFVK